MGADAEPETDGVCAAVKNECPDIKDLANINVDFSYDLMYDADGVLAGIRMTQSTGCKPLDEDLLVSQRKFKSEFHKPGEGDLEDGIHVAMPVGVARDAVRIVRPDHTSLSLGNSYISVSASQRSAST